MRILPGAQDRMSLLRESLVRTMAEELDKRGTDIDRDQKLLRACESGIHSRTPAPATPDPRLESLLETEHLEARTAVDRLLSDIRPGLMENQAHTSCSDETLRTVLPPTTPLADLAGVDVVVRPEPAVGPEPPGCAGGARVRVMARGASHQTEHETAWQLATVTWYWLAYQRLDGNMTFHLPLELHGFRLQNPISVAPFVFHGQRFSQVALELETDVTQDYRNWYGQQRETVLRMRDCDLPLCGRLDEVRYFCRSVPAKGSMPLLLRVRLYLEARARGEGAFAEVTFDGPDNWVRMPYVAY